MKKTYTIIAALILLVLVLGLLAVGLPRSHLSPDGSSATPKPTETPQPTNSPVPSVLPSSTPTASSDSPIMYTYSIIATYPHDISAFTEGLVYDNGVLYESTGEVSSLRCVDLASGSVLKLFELPNQYFGEGLALVNNSLIQLTWQNHIAFIYDKDTFDLIGNFSYPTEGWGLTYDGTRLIMSDGSSNLYFLDPVTFQRIGQISIHDGKNPVTNINELEYVNGDIYANIWLQQKIAIINPQNGQIKGWIDLSGIYQSNYSDAVLNGIAYDSATGRLFVTGKYWPYLYQIQIKPIS
ncbi:MAG: glutaminyl-peptide cyclotransferase [Candidatus Bathyarchaeota archaeon]|nr:glutaminyl-peptide cyclotransferase [Candidatus Bathyarchaeota archaeon]